MSAKKKTMKPESDNKFVEKTLLSRYWDIIVKENMGKTPEITSELDKLEIEIKKLRK